MQYQSNLRRNVALPKQEAKMEKKFFEKWLPFLANLAKKEEIKLLPVIEQVVKLYQIIGANRILYLEINNSVVVKDKNGAGLAENLPEFVRKNNKTVKTVYIVLRKEEPNLEITSNVEIGLLPSGSHASVAIHNYGMVQIPKSVKANNFEEDVDELLEGGYLDECERTFTAFTDSMGREFQNIFGIDPLISRPEKTIIVPAESNRKLSKFYNRKFISQERTYSPSFYKDSGISPAYQMGGYTDPFNILWWIIIYDFLSPDQTSGGNFIDSGGREINATQAAELTGQVEHNSLAQQLSQTSSGFDGNYETFPHAVEATKFEEMSSHSSSSNDSAQNAVEEEGRRDRSSSDASSAAVVGGTGGGDTDTGSHSSCSGGSSCGSSCSGGSSCGGGGCGGGGCGGGG